MATLIPGPGQLLADVQVTQIGAGQTVNTVSGTTYSPTAQSTTQMTPNSVGSTKPLTGTAWHCLYVAVHPGVLAQGATAPDLTMWVQVDNQDFSAYFYVDLSIGGLMFPRRQITVGGKVILLGESMFEWAEKVSRGAGLPSNYPIRFTGWKVTDDLTFYFASSAGFTTGAQGSGATFINPPTVQVYGDVFDATSAAYVSRLLGWNPTINLQSERRARAGQPAFGAQVPGAINLGSWKALPDGSNPGVVAVYRTFKYAYLNVAVAGTTITPLSSLGALNGKVGNVPNTKEDLGWGYASTVNAFRLTEIGRRPGAGAGYFGLFAGGNTIYPPETAYGLVCTPGNPRVYSGQVQPIREEANLYFTLQKWGQWSPGEAQPELIANETMALAVAAQNGQTIQPGTDETLVGGTTILGPAQPAPAAAGS
jgi:hypothetical protein